MCFFCGGGSGVCGPICASSFQTSCAFLCFGLWWEFGSLWSDLCFQFSNQLCFFCAFFVLFFARVKHFEHTHHLDLKFVLWFVVGVWQFVVRFVLSVFKPVVLFLCFGLWSEFRSLWFFLCSLKIHYQIAKKSTNQSTKKAQLERAYFQSGRTWPHYFLYFGCRPRSSGQDSPCCQLFWLYSPNRALA